jgi:hypothetical protein
MLRVDSSCAGFLGQKVKKPCYLCEAARGVTVSCHTIRSSICHAGRVYAENAIIFQKHHFLESHLYCISRSDLNDKYYFALFFTPSSADGRPLVYTTSQPELSVVKQRYRDRICSKSFERGPMRNCLQRLRRMSYEFIGS